MTTINNILEEYNIPATVPGDGGGRGGWIQIPCPDCGSTSSHGYVKHYLGISLSTGAANCWRCGRKDTARVLGALTGRPAREIRERLDGAVLAPPPVRPTGRLVLPGGRAPLRGVHTAYLAARGLHAGDMAALWGVEGLGQVGGAWRHLRWRLFIPIYHHGAVVSWTTRSIAPACQQRYLSAGAEQEAIPHKTILYGADYARHAIIVHEGPIDVWATGPGAVATCGTGYTEAQLLAMTRYSVRAVCFDTEPEAQERAKALAAALSAFPGTTHNVLLETGGDAAEADKGEIAELRRTFLE